MSSDNTDHIEEGDATDADKVTELRRAVRQSDSGAFLVEPRVTRRIVRELHNYARLSSRIPHTEVQVVRAPDVRRLTHPDELGLDSFEDLPNPVTLIALPEDSELESASLQDLMEAVWRRLFHGAVDRAIRANLASGRLNASRIRQHIETIGQVEFDEAHAVLVSELRLTDPESRTDAFAEFTAMWWELCRFAPDIIPIWFPSLANRHPATLIPDVQIDPDLLFEATRLYGARQPDLTTQVVRDEAQLSGVRRNWAESGHLHPSQRRSSRLQKRRQRAVDRSNTVAAGIFAMRCAEAAPSAGVRAAAFEDAEEDIRTLTRRLQQALKFADDEIHAWHDSLRELFRNSTHGFWNADKKLLHDLQKVCLDHERITYQVDLVKWIVAWRRRPLRRPLTSLREVLMAKHLSSSAARLISVRLSGDEREQLAGLLHDAADLAEEQMRQRLRPVVRRTLREVGFYPDNVPEDVAFDKLIEESLDCIAQRGYLTMGYLRDAISRNDLKLADLTDPRDLIRGDHLLRSDDKLDVALDGVYQRGEFYLRWLQVVSSLAFGTGVGRFLTLWVAIPIGGAVVVVEGIVHLIDVMRGAGHESAAASATTAAAPMENTSREANNDDESELTASANPEEAIPDTSTALEVVDATETELLASDNSAAAAVSITDSTPNNFDRGTPIEHSDTPVVTTESIGVHAAPDPNILLQTTERVSLILTTGLLLMALIHSPGLRRTMAGLLTALWNLVQTFCWGIPRKIVQFPPFRWLWRSWLLVVIRRYLIKPGLIAWASCGIVPLMFRQEPRNWWWVLGTGLLLSIAVNSRLGRDTEELVTEWVGNAWHHLRARVVVALFDWIVDFFNWVLAGLERVIYAVDEWLRFHSEETWVSIIAKALIGVVWSFVVFLIRIYVNLLIEPQINPIKHFPVVTVSHKIILPLTVWLHPRIVNVLENFMGIVLANSLVGTTLFLLPGVFGFLVWELTGNWRLYSSNRVWRLRPVVVGSHGETLPRLLRPGFHSGTLPKTFARLRRLERQEPSFKRFSRRRAWRDVLHHAERDVRRFAERDLIRLLDRCSVWHGSGLFVSDVRAASNSLAVLLDSPQIEGGPVELLFQEQSHWIVASVARKGLLNNGSPEQLHSFETALMGFYRKTGIELVREQLVRNLTGRYPYDVRSVGLIIWSDSQSQHEITIDLQRPYQLRPVPVSVAMEYGIPSVSAEQAIFARSSTGWQDWSRLWYEDHSETTEHRLPLACVHSANLSLLAHG